MSLLFNRQKIKFC
uniref:Uncharacterized protein n=1 Tax=Anguilla anguilla TaxID=7936 RepID=A0A0E9V7H1_ANGAN